MTRPLSAAILAATFFGAAIASAQTPEAAKRAPPMADPARIEAAKADVPKHTCGPVPDWPGKRASDNQKRAFERSAKTFGECIQFRAVHPVVDRVNCDAVPNSGC